MKRPRLFIPGPVDVDESVLSSMTQPMIGHRSPEFSDLYRAVTSGIGRLMSTENRVFLSTSSASGLWEATVRNITPSRTLCCVNGAFSSRWHATVSANGFAADTLDLEWGMAVKPEMIDIALSSGKYDLVTLVHNETSTGVANPLEEIAEVMKKYPDVLFAVDAVSSMVGSPIHVDRLGIDVLLASVQKAWALPPGFSICIVSEKVMERSGKAENKGYYFDFMVWDKYALRHQTAVTPSIGHMYGLQKQIQRIEEEGLENRFQRYSDMAERTRVWVRDRGQTMFSEEGYHSDTISCVRNGADWDLDRLATELLDANYRFSKGYGKLKTMTFRIPHMGETTLKELNTYLKTIDSIVANM